MASLSFEKPVFVEIPKDDKLIDTGEFHYLENCDGLSGHFQFVDNSCDSPIDLAIGVDVHIFHLQHR